jgi:leucyl-tRNA synthetase
MTQAQVRRKCRAYAEKFIDIQRDEFKRLGVMGEWANPYLTMSYRYEATIARECCKFALDGSLLRSKKPIHWCCSCKTALAEAEIEYHDEPLRRCSSSSPDRRPRDCHARAGRKESIRGDLDHHTLDSAGQPGRGPASRFRIRRRGNR